MPDIVYIDGFRIANPDKAMVRAAVESGHLVVVVDGARVPVQLTPELLKKK